MYAVNIHKQSRFLFMTAGYQVYIVNNEALNNRTPCEISPEQTGHDVLCQQLAHPVRNVVA